MPPNIIKSHILAKDIFKTEKIQNPLNYLNLKIGLKASKTNLEGTSICEKKNLESWGLYFIFFKKKLIYIGSWCGNYEKKPRKIKNRVSNQRWLKHLKTDTARFLPLNFLGKSEKKQDKLTIKTKSELEDFYNQKKNQIKKKYPKKLFNASSIYEDIIENILKINIDFNNKKHLQILYNSGADQSVNRFKIADTFWNTDFKNRDENNILDDFEFVYFKFENFIDYIPKDFLNNGSIKDEDAKSDISKKFRDEFEKPFIKKFSPPANNDDDKSDKEFKIVHDISIIDSIKKDLEDKYIKQNFFIK